MPKFPQGGHFFKMHLRPHLERHGLSFSIRVEGLEEFSSWLRRRRRGRPGDSLEGLPVAPNRPRDLSGGAAEELNYDE